MGGANSRNQEKGVILQAWVREILEKGNILHAFITICLFRMFELLCMNAFELWSWFRSNEKYDIHKNVLSLMQLHIFSLSQIRVLQLITKKKSRFA